MRNPLLSLAIFSLCAFSSAEAQVPARTVPAGATFRVRTAQAIDARSAHPGARFGGILEDQLVSRSGAVLIPRGAAVSLSAVRVSKSTRISGRDRVDLRVEAISYRGRTYPISSSVAQSRGPNRTKRALQGAGIGAGAGALIGGIASGGTGLAVGALVGGGGGTAAAAATGEHRLTIPAESVFSFQLQSPLHVK